ncbi:DUF2975 domain-containing protein [Mucilaginibacter sp. dw_454]|uniref:DUF2975 domain-containing protein n=1 Tax=Mucilaginibacter sp. dw_454 TaxID=2720079 RepID=UPI001BD20544|nr:DUF2975 domain-containing protein [Mucilaginibacter sp. dw_454]
MKILGNKSLSAFLAIVATLLFWAELAAGSVFVVMLFTAAHIRKAFALQVPISYSSTSMLQIYSAKRNGDFSILNTTDGILSIHIGASWQNIMILLTGYGLLFAVVVMITYQLKKIFGSFKQNQPFHKSNMYRVRYIAFVLISYSVIQWLFVIAVNKILLQIFIFDHLDLTYNFNINCFLMGIVLLAVEGIFRTGLALEEDKELVI